jgi:hypothetical protein
MRTLRLLSGKGYFLDFWTLEDRLGYQGLLNGGGRSFFGIFHWRSAGNTGDVGIWQK